jgi:hypothetical protein
LAVHGGLLLRDLSSKRTMASRQESASRALDTGDEHRILGPEQGETSCEQQIRTRPVVCLACTELPIAFPERKMLATFEHDGVLYINTTAARIDAAFDFAVN